MKIVAISDTHGKHNDLTIPKCDILIHAGDISMRGKIEEINPFLLWFNEQPATHKIFIAGNHDFIFQKMRVPIPSGITYLEDSSVTIEGLNIHGSPWTPYFYDWAFNGTDEFESEAYGPNLHRKWINIPKDTHILITHGPEYGILDKNLEGYHCGSRMLKEVIPILPYIKMHICGHIHEGYGHELHDDVNYYNACSLNRKYECVNKPMEIEL